MRQAQINVRTRACSRTSIARTKQAALTHNVRGKELIRSNVSGPYIITFNNKLESFTVNTVYVVNVCGFGCHVVAATSIHLKEYRFLNKCFWSRSIYR